MTLTIGHFLQALTDYVPTGRETAVTTVIVDSREAVPGSVFVAFSGVNVDGHNYVADAFARGAIAALIERPIPEEYSLVDTRYPLSNTSLLEPPLCLIVNNTMQALQLVAQHWRTHFNTRIVGIVGSIGKTTTKELTHAVLSQKYKTLKSEGNRNNEIGLPLTVLTLQEQHERAVLEMGMYTQGEIATLCNIAQPVIGVLTMIGPVHLERLGSMDAIVEAKTRTG